jgi:PAS domain S-box-containing protein
VSLLAKAYIALIIALGAVCITRGVWSWIPHDVLRFGCYLMLAIPAACLKVSLPGITGTMSVLFVLLLAGIANLGLPETLLIGVICALVQSLWHAKVRPRKVQLAFSIANFGIAISAAHLAYHAPFIPGEQLQAPLRIALAAVVYFVANTFPVAVVIALTEGKSVREVWGGCYCWTFPYYLVGAAIVSALSFANRMLNWQAWILILPVVYMIYRSYHLYLATLESERKRAEDQCKHADEVAVLHLQTMEALAAAVSANAKLDAVIQASPLAIFALDKQGCVTTWNLMAERILGWSAAEALGQRLPLADRCNEKHAASILERTLRGEVVEGLQTAERRKDNSLFEASIWSAPLKDPNDDSAGIVIAVADVSDRKRLEEQLRLSQKMEAVGRLAGGVAHDFNNLLTIINGYSSMLVHSLEDESYARTQADEILQAGNRAAELVSQLLTFSRRQVNQPKPIEINSLVQDVSKMLQRLLGEHIELKTILDARAGWIRADRNQMEGVLMNLSTNARDAMPEGGVLSISTSSVQILDSANQSAELAPGAYVRLTVADTGVGMDAEIQQHLFEPFFTTKEKGKGTGLGLSSVYGSVQHNGGKIFVSSELGKGTEFSIYLPAHEQVITPEQAPESPTEVRRGTETVLLVEDQTPVRRMLREALSNCGYRVWEAGNGAEALENWGSRVTEIDLLITDVVMPVMNGKKLAEHLGKLRPELRVIFMSGHAEDVLTTQGMLDASVDLLPKPFLPEALITKVRMVLHETLAIY